jgi:hypothetical protein
MNFNYEDDMEVERRIKKMSNKLSKEAKTDLNIDDIIMMLIEKKKYKQNNILQDSKQIRQAVVENAKLRRLKTLASIPTGNFGKIGVCGTSGQAGTSGIFKNIMSMNDLNCITEYTENMDYSTNEKYSFDNLVNSEFKESVKKLYESYKI